MCPFMAGATGEIIGKALESLPDIVKNAGASQYTLLALALIICGVLSVLGLLLVAKRKRVAGWLLVAGPFVLFMCVLVLVGIVSRSVSAIPTPTAEKYTFRALPKDAQGQQIITSANALSLQDEPSAIKDLILSSKGVEKHWVNFTSDGYVLTLLLPTSISSMDSVTVRGYGVLATRIRNILESQNVPLKMVVFRSFEGLLFAAG